MPNDQAKYPVKNQETVSQFQHNPKSTVHTNNNHPIQSEILKLFDKQEIARQVEQAINKILLQQNNMVILDKSDQAVWNASLPLIDKEHIDQLDINIYRDQKPDSDSKEGVWTAEVSLELANLGKFYAKICLYNEQIQAFIWAEHEPTLELINQHIETLHQQFQRSGIDVNSIHTLTQAPDMNKNPIMNKQLIDVHL